MSKILDVCLLVDACLWTRHDALREAERTKRDDGRNPSVPPPMSCGEYTSFYTYEKQTTDNKPFIDARAPGLLLVSSRANP